MVNKERAATGSQGMKSGNESQGDVSSKVTSKLITRKVVLGEPGFAASALMCLTLLDTR